jgi:hypothetical protein
VTAPTGEVADDDPSVDAVPQTPAQRSDLRKEQLATELRKGHRVRFQVTAIFVVVVLALVGFFAYDRWQRRHDCEVAQRVRQHSEQLDRDVFTRLGTRFRLSADELEAVLDDDIGAAYDAMPKPAACH